MSANDIRELENLDRIPAEDGGDLYLINGNMLPLGNAGLLQIPTPTMTERRKTPMKKFWKWKNQARRRQLRRNGRCSERHHRRGKLV